MTNDKPKNSILKSIIMVFGYFILFLVCMGALFKIQHWPGAGIMITVGFSLFFMFFIPVFFIMRILEKKGVLNVFVNVLAMCSLSMIFMGILFKLQHWPGAGMFLMLGTLVFVFPTLILYIIQQVKEEGKNFGEYWRMVFTVIIVSVFFMAYCTNYSREIIYGFVKIEDGVLQTNKNIAAINENVLKNIVLDSASNSSDAALQIDKATRQMYSQIEEVKKTIIQHTDGSDIGIENHWDINSLDNYDIPTHALGTAKSPLGIQLGEALNQYNSFLISTLQEAAPGRIDKFKGVDMELHPNMQFDEDATWHELLFYHAPLSGTLSLLTGLQNQVLNAETEALLILQSPVKN